MGDARRGDFPDANADRTLGGDATSIRFGPGQRTLVLCPQSGRSKIAFD